MNAEHVEKVRTAILRYVPEGTGDGAEYIDFGSVQKASGLSTTTVMGCLGTTLAKSLGAKTMSYVKTKDCVRITFPVKA